MSQFPKVRPATSDDLEEILALWSHFIRTHSTNPAYRNLPRGALDLRRELYVKRIEGTDSEVFVVGRPDGGLDGMITCFVEENLPYLRPRFYCRLQTPFVRPDARGRGNLKKLLNVSYRWARERELTEVRLYTAADNLLANALADELGFTAFEVARRRPIDWSMPPREEGE